MVALGANLAKRHITNVKVVIMTTSDLRAAKYSPRKFVDWLLACDIHFILSHVNQSLLQSIQDLLDIGDFQLNLKRECSLVKALPTTTSISELPYRDENTVSFIGNFELEGNRLVRLMHS